MSGQQLDDRRSRWVAKAPGRRTVEWDPNGLRDEQSESAGTAGEDGGTAAEIHRA